MSIDTGGTRRTFLGIPVTGQPGEPPKPQKPLSELEPLIRDILADPYIRAFGWYQYTPYFNDGDRCEFTVGNPWFVTVDDTVNLDEDEDEDEDEDGEHPADSGTYDVDSYSEHPTLGKLEGGTWVETSSGHREKVGVRYIGNREVTFRRCLALTVALDTEAFNAVLLEAFGDNTYVRVTRDGIRLDEYDPS